MAAGWPAGEIKADTRMLVSSTTRIRLCQPSFGRGVQREPRGRRHQRCAANRPGGRRRVLIPRYPFGIFYVAESNRIVIHAILDLRQDPEKIRERFSE